MENSVEQNSLIISIVALVLTALGLIVTVVFSFVTYFTSKKVNKYDKYQIDKKKLIIKTWNEMKKAFETYSILVPKSKYSDWDSFDYWDNIVQTFRNNGIIYQSVKIFFHKFEDNWKNINKIATSGLRTELEKLEIEEIQEILNFWEKVNKKLEVIDPIIEKIKILDIDNQRTSISTNLQNLKIFYINICPEYDKKGLWIDNSSTYSCNEVSYSKKLFDVSIKEEQDNFEEELKSKKWNLELKFFNPKNEALEYIFSVQYENDIIVNIKSRMDINPFHLHKENNCNCYFKEILNDEDKTEIEEIAFGLICLTKLLKINIIEFIPFLKKVTQCKRMKYLKSELKSFL